MIKSARKQQSSHKILEDLFMLNKPKDKTQLGFYSTFEEQLNSQHDLYKLANVIDCAFFEHAFSKHYSPTHGKPAKPIRLLAVYVGVGVGVG